MHQKVFIIYFSFLVVMLILLYVYIDVTECWNNDNSNDDDNVNKSMHGDRKQEFLQPIALATFQKKY